MKTYTEIEIPHLPAMFNLTDGHVYRQWSKEEKEIIDTSAYFFYSVNRQQLQQLEKEYLCAFTNLTHQTLNFSYYKYLMCTSASMGIEVIANYLRLNKLSLTLVEPCFDSLVNTFRRHHIKLEAFSDSNFDKFVFKDSLRKIKTDAICFVSPNNPTGNYLIREDFLALTEYCAKNNKLLILDFCFRAYLPEDLIFDQYYILEESKINCFIIEDTGKTWPTVELKASFIAISPLIYKEIYPIYTDFILHASPFTIKLMTEFIKLSQKDNLEYIKGIVRRNRNELYKNIKGTILTPVEQPYSSMAWLKIKDMTGTQLKKVLDANGIHVLEGDYFYWSNPKQKEPFIRIALTRDPTIFKTAAEMIGKICHKLK